MIITISLSKTSAALMRLAAMETNRTPEDLAAWSVKEALADHHRERSPLYIEMSPNP